MDSRFIESLLAVIETGSMVQASRKQHLTAAAVGQRIRKLESDLGVTLISREGLSFRPTEACNRILDRARQIVDEVERLALDLKHCSSSMPLRLGVIPSQLVATLLIKVDALRFYFEDKRIHLTQGTSRELYQALLNEQLDAVIIEAPDFETPQFVNAYLLRTEPLVVISAQKLNLPIEDALATLDYVEFLPDPFIENIASKYLEEKKIVPHVVCDTCSLESIKVLVNEDAGISLVPYWPGLDTKDHQCVVTRLDDCEHTRKIVLLTSTQNDQQPILEKFLELFAICKHGSEHSSETGRALF